MEQVESWNTFPFTPADVPIDLHIERVPVIYSVGLLLLVQVLESKDRTVNLTFFLSYIYHSPFFLIPIFRGDGYFHLVSQFQDRHFVCTYLSEYQQHPSGAQPLLTCSVFDDFDTITLVRTDVVNVGIQEDEGRKVVKSLLDSYENDKEFQMVKNFNEFPDMFDVDSYVESQRRKWENVNGNIDTSDDNIPVSPVPVL